jgi:hypothetical protein
MTIFLCAARRLFGGGRKGKVAQPKNKVQQPSDVLHDAQH